MSVKPLLLDLFCGAGGATKGYQDAGFEVIGVDINPQPNYCGDKFWQADALEFLGEGFDRFHPFNYVDAIHASPPCQRWSTKTKNREKHPDLITPLRPMLEISGLPYVIENVPGAPLVDPKQLCGSTLGLRVRRHRLFETNFPLRLIPPCDHNWQDADKPFLLYDHGKWFRSGIVHVFGSGGGKGRDYWPHAMGCGDNWDECWMTPAELAEAIPPSYTEHIGAHLKQHIRSLVAAGVSGAD
jgi:DNA (cytosine-5)-methyltransferase 1